MRFQFPKLQAKGYALWNIKVLRLLETRVLKEHILMEPDVVLSLRMKWHDNMAKSDQADDEKAYWAGYRLR